MARPPISNLESDRRAYLKSLGAFAGLSALSGCVDLSSGFESDRAVRTVGALPAHQLERRTRRVGEPKSGGSKALPTDGLVSQFAATGSAERFELRASVDGRDIAKAGTVSAASTVSRSTYWEAPHDGAYQVAAAYDGNGAFRGSLQCPEVSDDKALLFSATELSILQGEDDPLASVQRVHLEHGDDGTGKLAKKIVTELVEFIVSKILSRWFGPLAELIADEVATAVVAYGEAIVDVLTGDCYTVYFAPRYDNEFRVSASEGGSIAASFGAEAGRTYKIRFSPVVGSVLSSKTYTTASRAVMKSEYDVRSLTVSRQ
ncbi:MAG: hypothetical protein ABEK02_04785 [Haloquadratum sp.]